MRTRAVLLAIVVGLVLMIEGVAAALPCSCSRYRKIRYRKNRATWFEELRQLVQE